MGCLVSRSEPEILFDVDSVTHLQMDALNALAEMKLILYQYNVLHNQFQEAPEQQVAYDNFQRRRQVLCTRFDQLKKHHPTSILVTSFKTLDERWKKASREYEDSGNFLPF